MEPKEPKPDEGIDLGNMTWEPLGKAKVSYVLIDGRLFKLLDEGYQEILPEDLPVEIGDEEEANE